jgi:hypothetical protein
MNQEPTPRLSTPDDRYLIARGRLWRKTNPTLPARVRDALVRDLMKARRSLRGEQPAQQDRKARQAVDAAKTALGERGPIWWRDGAPDYNRRLVKNTPYAAWFASLTSDE